MKRISFFISMVLLLAACNTQLNPESSSVESQGQQWELLGDKVNTGLGAEFSMALRANDKPVIALYDILDQTSLTFNVVVKEWNGQQWVALGGAVGQTVFPPSVATRRKNAPGSPLYDPVGVAYSQRTIRNNLVVSDIVRVKVWLAGRWFDLGQVSGTGFAADPSLALDSFGGPVVAYNENFILNVKRWNGQGWTQLGGEVGKVGPRRTFKLALNSSNTPYVTFRNNDTGRIDVKRWTGSSWVNVGKSLGTSQSGRPSLAFDKTNQPLVTWYDTDYSSASPSANVHVSRWNGKTWVGLGDTLNIDENQSAFDPSMAVDSSGKPIVTWSEGSVNNGGNIYVKRWNGTQWERIGNGIDKMLSNDTGEPLVVVNSANRAIVAWAEFGSSGNVYVKQQK
jgi:hypothetical protein